jgi:hypothetical protein
VSASVSDQTSPHIALVRPSLVLARIKATLELSDSPEARIALDKRTKKGPQIIHKSRIVFQGKTLKYHNILNLCSSSIMSGNTSSKAFDLHTTLSVAPPLAARSAIGRACFRASTVAAPPRADSGIYERALRLIVAKVPDSPAAEIAKNTLELGAFDPSTT